MKISTFVTTAILSALGTLAACNNDTPTGALTIPFQIGSNGVCSFKNPAGDDVPVTEVTISLYRKGTLGKDGAEVLAQATADCADGEVSLGTVNSGTYDIRAEGTDADRLVVFDNDGEGDIVEVLEGQDIVADSVRLNLTPAKLNVRWMFTGFEFNQCTQVPLKTLSVEARRDGGGSSLGEGSFSCDSAADVMGGYHKLVDDGRDLNGNDIDTVEIVPQDGAGKKIGDVASFSFDPPGPGRTINLTISIVCTATECDLSGSGVPDAT